MSSKWTLILNPHINLKQKTDSAQTLRSSLRTKQPNFEKSKRLCVCLIFRLSTVMNEWVVHHLQNLRDSSNHLTSGSPGNKINQFLKIASKKRGSESRSKARKNFLWLVTQGNLAPIEVFVGWNLCDSDVAECAGFVDLVENVDDGVRLIKVAALALTHMSEHSVFTSAKDERGCCALGYSQTVCKIGGIHHWLFHQRFGKLSNLRSLAMAN